MIQVKKKERETAESLIRRFSRRVQQSGVLRKVRRDRFFDSGKSKIDRRSEALYKVKIRKEIDRSKKMGKFDDETLREIKKKMNR
jgi:ribosomal protein S21